MPLKTVTLLSKWYLLSKIQYTFIFYQRIHILLKIIIGNLKNLGRPPAFACHREKSSKQAKEITYDDCKVITDGMNPRTGIFTVKVFFVDLHA